MTNPFVVERWCAPCMQMNTFPRERAQYVATDMDGMQWFVCEACCGAVRDGVSYIKLTHWFAMHGLEHDAREQVRADLAAGTIALDAADVATEA